MTKTIRLAIALAALSTSVVVGTVMLSTHGPRSDLSAYALSLLALMLAVCALAVLYPGRSSLGNRFVLTTAILLTLFWSLEFFGGVAWFTLDKLARHYQHPCHPSPSHPKPAPTP